MPIADRIPERIGAAALIWFFLSVATAPAHAQGGALDTSFSADGKQTTNLSSGYDCGYGVALQAADGKIVVAGETAGGGGQFALARYTTDGALDTSFGGDGKVATNITSGYDWGADLAIQSADGKIVVVGRAAGSGGRFALARYNTDGSLDSGFGGDGKVTTNFSPRDDFIFGVEIQTSDGKIVVAGRAGGSGGRIALARYNEDGSLDPGFSGDGKATTNFTSGDDRADILAVNASDGTIVAAGTAGYFSNNAKFAVVRYNPDGTPDTAFSGDGKVTTSVGSGRAWGFALAIQPSDGKLVAGGQAEERLALARYNLDGTLDSSFSGDGKVAIDFTSGTDYTDDIAIQPGDDKIVTAGSANYFGPDARFALARFIADGTLDGSFSGDGKVTTNFTSGLDRAYGVDLQPSDGKIVASGCAGGSGGRFALARYLAA